MKLLKSGRKKMNKKGSVTDPIFVGAFILITAMTIFIGLYVWFQFQEGMEITIADSPGNATIVQVMDELRASYISIDYMIPLMVGGLMIVSMIFAFQTGASVIYAFISIVLWGFAMLMASVFTNIFEEFSTNFPTVSAELPMLVFIMSNMKWIVLVWVFLISLVMFSKNKQDDDRTRLTSAQEAFYG